MSTSDRPTIVLVHGAWHGPWCWDRLRSALHETGWKTTAPQLPSAALPSAGRAPAGLRDDIAALGDHLDHIEGPIALVAHSYGGMPVTEAVALRQERIAQLIYIAAYLPRVGDSLFSLHGAPVPEDLRGTVAVPDNPIDTFYNDVDPALAFHASQRLVPQSTRSWAESIERSGRTGTPSTYMVCERDHALPTAMQELFAAQVDVVVRLQSGHSPFLSQPDELAARLGQSITAAAPEHTRTTDDDLPAAAAPGRPD